MDTRILTIRYLGNAKKQPGYDERVAFGHDGENWSVVIPETILVAWFSGTQINPTDKTTLYGVLGIYRDASTDEIRAAFRRQARTWHADVNRLYEDETNNKAFIRVKEAYDILSNPEKRARYDAGLALENSLKLKRNLQPAPVKYVPGQDYRPAKRSGYVMADGEENDRGQFVVSQIHEWEPIIDASGRHLVATWLPGEKQYTETWMQTPRRPA